MVVKFGVFVLFCSGGGMFGVCFGVMGSELFGFICSRKRIVCDMFGT